MPARANSGDYGAHLQAIGGRRVTPGLFSHMLDRFYTGKTMVCFRPQIRYVAVPLKAKGFGEFHLRADFKIVDIPKEKQ